MNGTEELDALRQRVADLKAEAETLADAGRAHSETRAALRQRLEMLHAEGSRRLQHIVAATATDGKAPGGEFEVLTGHGAANLGPLLLAVFGVPDILKRLDRYVTALPDGPTTAARAERSGVLAAQLFEAELAEEREVSRLEALGVPVQRRGDADPGAVLWLDPAA